VGVQGEASAIADVVLAGRVFGELVLGRGVLAPSVRVAVAQSLDVDRQPVIGHATLRWTTGGLDICPIRLALAAAPAIDARPCAGLAVGILKAEGDAIGNPESRSRPWVAASVQGRLVWAIIRALAIEVEGGAEAPFVRESFFFEPTVPVYEAPPIAGFARAGVSVRFP
jgi:hypothetical protein